MANEKKERGKALKEFKEFILRGNIFDMAVGVIIGGAFGKIVTSLVNDILMPAIGVLLGGLDFKNMKYVITAANEAEGIEESAISYGLFIQNIVDFLLIALCIFLMIKFIAKITARFKKKEEEKEEEPEEPAKSDETVLLEEIRDLLKDSAK